jgi:signal transduction histidine kinase
MDLDDVTLLVDLERAHLSELIHDDVLQILGAGLLSADTCQQALSRGRTDLLAEHMVKLQSLLAEATDRLRALMSDLRPYEAGSSGLRPALERIIDTHRQRFGGEVTLGVKAAPSPDLRMASLAYRCILDLLQSVREPAEVSRALLGLSLEGQKLAIDAQFDIADGSSRERVIPPSRIEFMRWRVRSLGGSFDQDSTSPRSAVFRVVLPA